MPVACYSIASASTLSAGPGQFFLDVPLDTRLLTGHGRTHIMLVRMGCESSARTGAYFFPYQFFDPREILRTSVVGPPK